MNTEQLMQEIREVNLSYMMLAQHLIRADKAQALYRLGISEDVAGVIDSLTPAQMLKVASGATLMSRFRFDDEMVWNLLTSHNKPAATEDSAHALHASIVMASNFAEATSRQ
ncbi:flagellar transcriptional regulator FlhD [Derxia lacustris]|uniref:flagellar transcriptional regulator FlhD n=1 Tax=Derxia lacustris TaxID=764842 RepID=UPI000A175F43|nr:flagellar transcriptional regulator FlhD [Derxia lacustris]